MTNVVVVGAQWGDEGKGKIVDWLSARADVVVRFQGGHNAGHTLVVDGKVYKLHLLPSGIVRGGKMSYIGNGVVLDPWALLKEIDNVREQGLDVNPSNLRIADNTPLILPVHGAVDKAREAARNGGGIGTTGRGIGPAYEDKVARRAIRLCDLNTPDLLAEKINDLLVVHNATLRGFGEAELDAAQITADLMALAPRILPFQARVWELLQQAINAKQTILFEGAQGALLDVDHGTYPFVTASNTCAAAAAIGAGIGPQHLGYILGLVKAYTTRVGAGPFPTELFDEIGEHIGQRGHEFGTTTGRKRRCGWFDAVLVKQSIQLNGINGIALTKLDVLDEMPELKICVAYELNGQRIDYLPANAQEQANVKPIYETLPGWQTITAGMRKWEQLPANALKYIARIEELCGAPVALHSTSPEREDTILRIDPFA